MKFCNGSIVMAACALVMSLSGQLPAATIGIDAAHGWDSTVILATGSQFTSFRSTIIGLGHTITPVSAFDAANLVGLDALIILTPYSQNAHSAYSASEIAAIQAFTQKAVFLSDSNPFSNTGDRPLGFGDNLSLLSNSIGFLAGGGGLFSIGENGSGFNAASHNQVVAPYGITYSSSATNPTGHTISSFVSHPVTLGLQTIGVDYQLRITTAAPSIDLTTFGAADDALSVFSIIPVPSAGVAGLMLIGAFGLARKRRGA